MEKPRTATPVRAGEDPEVKENMPEVLEVTLSMPELYPPPSMITAAPQLDPLRLLSPPLDFEDECDSDSRQPKTMGKKGGPSIPESIQNTN